MSDNVINYSTMGLADSSGISGVYSAPSGSMYYDESENQFCIAVNSGWYKLSKQIETHKVENNITITALSSYSIVTFGTTLIQGDWMYYSIPSIRVNKPGIYEIECQCAIDNIEMMIETSTGYQSFSTKDRILRDVIELDSDERIDLKIKRVGSKNILAAIGSFRMIIENR